MTRNYDAIIIGIGRAAPALADRMGDKGLRVALIGSPIEDSPSTEFDSDTARALVASARTLFVAKRAAEFGIVIPGQPQVDFPRVTARLNELQAQSQRCRSTWISRMKNVDLLLGKARFVAPGSVEVNGEKLHSDRIFIDVPTRWERPQVPGIDRVEALTPVELLQLPELPEHLVIYGGSYTGLEFAQIFRRLGSQVTLIEPGPRLVQEEDTDTSSNVKQLLEAEGVRIRLNAKEIEFVQVPEGIAVESNCCGNSRTVVASHLLIASERLPETEDLNLGVLGIETDSRGFIAVDDNLRTSAPNVWALGDCNGRGGFGHASSNDHEIIADDLCNQEPAKALEQIPCYGVFTDPPLGRVGMSEAQARMSGRKVLVGKWPMSNVPRARAEAESHGFIKVLVDADTQEVLGATVLGINGDEVVHQILAAMHARTPFSSLARAAHIRTTVSALLPSTLHNLVPLA